MSVFPKFIVEGNNLIIALCTFHKQLIIDKNRVKGGGMWKWDKKNNIFTLSGESHYFGAASADDIRACIMAGNIFWSYNGGRRIWGHTFYFNDGIETIKL